MKFLKNWGRKLLWFLHLDITRNLRYDRATQRIMRSVLQPDSNCIDVGAHKGEILELILNLAPNGKHLAIEPIPELAGLLNNKYGGSACTIEACAISNYEGSTEFHVIKNAPAYSGLRPRKYAVAHPEIEKISVQVKTLDKLWDVQCKVDLIKLDIEGGELHALEGAGQLIRTHKPYIIFEFGLGSAEFYESTPTKMFNFFQEMDMCIAVLDQWKGDISGLDKATFIRHFQQQTAYYFIAFPCSK